MARVIDEQVPLQKKKLSQAAKRKHGGDKADQLARAMVQVMEQHMEDAIRHDHVQAFELVLRNRVGSRLHGAIDDARLVELLVRHNAHRSIRKLCPFDKYNRGDHLATLPLPLLVDPAHHSIVAYFLYNRDTNVLRQEMIEGQQRRLPVIYFRVFSLLVLVGTDRPMSVADRLAFFKEMVVRCDFGGERTLYRPEEEDYQNNRTQQRFLTTLLDTLQCDALPYDHDGFASHRTNPVREHERSLFTRALLETLSDEALEDAIAREQKVLPVAAGMIKKQQPSDDEDKTWEMPRTALSRWAFCASQVLSERMGPIGTELANTVEVFPACLVHLICSMLSSETTRAVHPPHIIISAPQQPQPQPQQQMDDKTSSDTEDEYEDEEDRPISKRARIVA